MTGSIGGSKPKHVTTPQIVQKILRLKQENPALFAWEIRDLLRRELFQSRSAGSSHESSSIPSISSINRILRGGLNGPGFADWSPGTCPVSSVTASSSSQGRDSRVMRPRSPSVPPPARDSRPGKKYSSYHIEELLRDEPHTGRQSHASTGSPSQLVTLNSADSSPSQLYYSYYCQALLAHYNSSSGMQTREDMGSN